MSAFQPLSSSSLKSKISFTLAVLILLALFFIPYKEIRAERIRAFGENKAVGIVIEKINRNLSNEQKKLRKKNNGLIRYRFIDPLGLARERIAQVEDLYWESLSPGDSIIVYYAKANPIISRLKYEKENTVTKILAKISRFYN